jgi:hypothetical protein
MGEGQFQLGYQSYYSFLRCIPLPEFRAVRHLGEVPKGPRGRTPIFFTISYLISAILYLLKVRGISSQAFEDSTPPLPSGRVEKPPPLTSGGDLRGSICHFLQLKKSTSPLQVT